LNIRKNTEISKTKSQAAECKFDVDSDRIGNQLRRNIGSQCLTGKHSFGRLSR